MNTDVTDRCTRSGFFSHFSVNLMREKFYSTKPEHYDEQGRAKKRGKKGLHWKRSARYEHTRRRKATKERKLADHRKSLHGRMVHEIMKVGNTVILEKISYQGWQKQYGKSVGLRAPGMSVEQLRRTVASTGGTLIEVSTQHPPLAILSWLRSTGQKTALAQGWKRGSTAQNPRCFSTGSPQKPAIPPLSIYEPVSGGLSQPMSPTRLEGMLSMTRSTVTS